MTIQSDRYLQLEGFFNGKKKILRYFKNSLFFWIAVGFFLIAFGWWFSMASSSFKMEAKKMQISNQVVFLYYPDLDKATQFYESVMGFKLTFSLDWVKIYQVTESSSIGIVDEKKGFHKSSQDKPVMLSLTTNDVDGWFHYLQGKGIKIISSPEDNLETGIRAFMFDDPGGYTLEIFRWIKR